jgi:hypothetical protein
MITFSPILTLHTFSAKAGQDTREYDFTWKKIKEETESPLISEMTRGSLTPEEDRAKGPKFLVQFSIEKTLPLIGSGEHQNT